MAPEQLPKLPKQLCPQVCEKAMDHLETGDRTRHCVARNCKADEHYIGAQIEAVGKKNKKPARGSGGSSSTTKEPDICQDTSAALRVAMDVQLFPRKAVREDAEEHLDAFVAASRLSSSEKGQLSQLFSKDDVTMSNSVKNLINKIGAVVRLTGRVAYYCGYPTV